jgi:hypothetical protein
VLQKTGEQVKQMAQGAADAVKHTLGMGKDNNNTDHVEDDSPGNKQQQQQQGYNKD